MKRSNVAATRRALAKASCVFMLLYEPGRGWATVGLDGDTMVSR